MVHQTIQLLRILLNRRITKVPLRVLRELRKRGVRRLPGELDTKVERKNRVPIGFTLRFLRSWLGSEQITRYNGKWIINSFVPPFPGRAFDRAFENLLSSRKFSPISAFLAITAQCEYGCWHCSHKMRATDELKTAQWFEIIKQLNGLGTSIIGFTGGEPLMRPDIPEMVKAAADEGAVTIMFTTGNGLTEELANKLKQAGLWSLCISLDEPTEKEYDSLRGHKGAFATAINAIRLAKRLGFYVMTGSVATRRFVEQRLFEPIHAIGANEGVHEMRIVEPMPCGNLAEGSEEMLLKPFHINTLKEFHITTNKRCKAPKVCAFNFIEGPEVFGCAGGIQHMFIDSAGNVCPCDFTPLSFGNITKEPLETIWPRMNQSMGLPKQSCFIQKYHSLISKYAKGSYPVRVEKSCEICAQIPPEPLPAYYKMVLSGGNDT